jgi:hypothetical protein
VSEMSDGPAIPGRDCYLGERYGAEQMMDELRRSLPCSVCGELWIDAWGTAETFVCPECLTTASNSITGAAE